MLSAKQGNHWYLFLTSLVSIYLSSNNVKPLLGT